MHRDEAGGGERCDFTGLVEILDQKEAFLV